MGKLRISDGIDVHYGSITAKGGIDGLTLNNGISGSNFNISGVNQLTINDPGEGIAFGGGSAGTITLAVVDDSNDNIVRFTNAAYLQVGTDTVWHAGNDGSGSGLDADLLDGNHASAFLTSYTETDTLATVTGRGASTSTSVTLSGTGNHISGHHYFDSYDNNGNHYPHYLSGSSNNGAQINLRVQRSGSSAYDVLYIAAGSNDMTWRGNKIWNAGNDGSGSGLDADKLDNQQGSYYLDYNNFSNTPTIPSSADFLSKTYSSNWTRLGYGTSGSAYWHRLAQVTIDGSYKDYLLKIKWTSRYNHGELAIHIHSDNDTTADVWDATMRQFGESNTKSINDFKYIQSGSNVQIWIRTPGWREFDYIRQDAVTEGTPTINWYKEGDSGASKQTSDPGGTVFTDHTPWSPMNDGSGSGLDADLLDGMQPKSATGAAGSNQILRTHSNGYLYMQNWIDVGGAGLYSTSGSGNGAHLYPNTVSDYGAWRMNGARNGWNGITFDPTNVTLMANADRMGFYNDADNEWMIDCNRNGSVDMYYDGTMRLWTKSTGIGIAGGITSTGSWSTTNGSYGTQTIGFYYGAAYWNNTGLSYYIGNLTSGSNVQNKLYVKGSIAVGSATASSTYGRIDASNDIVAYSSDKRLKENILPINGALDKISKLSGFTYNWNEKAKEKAAFNTEERLVGVFAQDVQEVLPEAVKLAPFDNDGSDVSKSGEDYLTVQYEKIVPLLIEGMKEQQAQIEKLTTILEEVTKQLNNGNNI